MGDDAAEPLETVRAALLESGLEPQYLEIELTESVMLGDTTAAEAQPAALGPLQQHHADQQQGEDEMHGQDDVFHGRQPYVSERAYLGTGSPEGKRPLGLPVHSGRPVTSRNMRASS